VNGYAEKVGNVGIRYLQDTRGWFFQVVIGGKTAETGRRFPSFIAARNEVHRLYNRRKG
jgi:hypothetical protein